MVFRAEDVGIAGYEDRETLDAKVTQSADRSDPPCRGERMNLGDVTDKSVPKMVLVAPLKNGGAVTVRRFIPHRTHATIGVLGAVSVATGCLLAGSGAAQVAQVPAGPRNTLSLSLSVEHPTGDMTSVLETDEDGVATSAALLRTARKLMVGIVYV
ncbi:PrpF domain-containing protein [Altericroceibacterium spongiae]|uniref:PrpF domain-containing protein n=1 Tax=Altericroceibacterium spongiae TaxID=2320269 RepID=UPI002367D767|nr:PrpF domain-containing protein [Altericroceibacterium spongiae]